MQDREAPRTLLYTVTDTVYPSPGRPVTVSLTGVDDPSVVTSGVWGLVGTYPR